MDNLVLLQNFSSNVEAELAKQHLAAEGVKSIIQRGDGVSASQVLDFCIGADLFVTNKDFLKAKKILGVRNEEKNGL